jgi:phage repressor protein C with HTH and peptisase S24 domain
MSKRKREADLISNRQFEYDVDGLVEAIGRLFEADADGPLWRDPRFVDWLAVETREHDRRAQRRTDRELVTQGRATLARLRARQLSVTRVVAAPRLRMPSVCGTPGDVLLPAARERAAPVIELGVAAGIGRELWDESVDNWLEIPPDVPAGQYLALKVSGESMAPLMHTGDTVLVRLGAEVDRDTVVVARHPDDGYVCKRVGRLRGDAIELTSLEPGRPPITIPRDPRFILGTVLMVWCEHGH